MAQLLSLPDFVLVFVIVLFRIRLTSGFVSIVVLSPLGFHLVLLSAGKDRFCCHFILWLRWVCHSIEHFLWDGVFNPVWFSPLARLSHWFCVCNRHHTGCLHGIGWRCHERRLCHGCFSCSLWSLTFCRVLSFHLFFCSLTLSGFLVRHRLSCSRLFHFSLVASIFRSLESVLRVWPPCLVDTLFGRWHALH